MSERIADDRGYAAALARRYLYDRSVSSEIFLKTFQETSDTLIAELLDLIAHEPARTGLLGANYDEYTTQYWPHVAAVLQELERGAAGRVPRLGRFTFAKLLSIAMLGLFAFASDAEHIASSAPSSCHFSLSVSHWR